MNNNVKKLSYGITDFQELVTENYAYVDKTRFIELLENEHNPYHIFIRPRKFGKSLLLSTFYYYYSINEANKFTQLFGNHYIGRNPTPKKGQYAVMNFNFSGIDTNSEDRFTDSFNDTVRKTIQTFVEQYFNVIPGLESRIRNLENRQLGIMALRDAFDEAMLANVKIFAIVDEYDHFANDLIAMGNQLGKNIYDQMVKANGLVRDFYETLKIGTAFSLKRIFITGISPVMLNDLTSGFNIAENLTLDPHYNEMLGFTHEEVQQLIKETDIDTTLIDINLEDYYNGYKFHIDGENKVYNPTMIMGYLNQIVKYKKIPTQLVDQNLRTDYSRLERLIGNDSNKKTLLQIIQDGFVEAEIISQFSIDKMYSDDYFVSLLLYMGLLTIDKYHEGVMRLKIPNYSIQTLYWSYLIEIIASDNPEVNVDNTQLRNTLRELAYRGNPQPFIDYISQSVFNKFSNRDLIQFNEKYIKAVLLCALLLAKIYVPNSEYEVENGYIDIFLQRKPDLPDIKYEWVWEVKYVKVEDEDKLPIVKNQAVKQLQKYKQATIFHNRTDLKFAALLFIGKDKYEIQEVD
jgi:hypothetical protein